jgi:hypothetical protein
MTSIKISHQTKVFFSVFPLSLLFLLSCSAVPSQVVQSKTVPPASPSPATVVVPQSPTDTLTIYLPTVTKTQDKFVGIYLDQFWTSQNVKTYMPLADQAAGKKHSSVGWFIDLEDWAFRNPPTDLSTNNLYLQLEELWKSGYFSFINLSTNTTASQILNGERDLNIARAAEIYKAWIDLGGGRKAMIAPLQEMNGTWTSYGKASTSTDIKAAFRYIVNKFIENGVERNQVWWTFAPNAWNPAEDESRKFENYYPGDDVVDFVGISSYNYGFCPSTASVSGKWESYPEIFAPYIPRMRAMAPSKPIIIAETATTAYYDYEKADQNRKNQWLIENYNFLASTPEIVGIYYFSFTEFNDRVCDFEVSQKGNFSTGYRDGIANPMYAYLNAKAIDGLIR